MNRGNNAYQYDYNATQEEYIIPEEKIEEKRIILTELRRKKEDKKTKRNIIVGITILVMMGLTVAFRYASVTQINYENHKLEQEYQQKTAVVQNLQVDIESNMNIAEIAEKQLNGEFTFKD